MDRLALTVEDALRYRDALTRLNLIVALGPAEGEELAARVAALAASVIRCELEGSAAPETTPRCLSCGLILRAAAPFTGLGAVVERLQHVTAIEDPEVRVADNFEIPEQCKTQCTADSAGNFGDQLAPAERCDANLDRGFFVASLHFYQQ